MPMRADGISLRLVSFLFLLFLLKPVQLAAQAADIRGTVSDSTTGEKIPFANVILRGTAKGATSNATGFYLIPNIAPGTYEVVARVIGYHEKVRRVTIADQRAITLDFSLVPEAVEMQEMVVTEQRQREVREISTSMHILDQREMKMIPAAVQEDVFRSIQILPGVVSTGDVNSQFYVRGGAADQNLILLDGIRIYSPYHAMGVFSIFDSDIINTTEVYTGAFPPGYGGRLSSVISLTTKEGTTRPLNVHSNINFLSSKLQMNGSTSESFRWLVNARKSLFSNAFKKFFHQDVPVSFYDVFAKTTYEQPETHLRFNMLGFFTGDQLLSPKSSDPDYYWNNWTIGAKLSTLFGDRLFVNTVLSTTNYESRRDPKTSTVISPASTKVQETMLRGEATHYSDNGTLYYFGFDFSFPHLEYHVTNSNGVPRDISNSPLQFSGWLRTQFSWGLFQAEGGLHVEFSSLARSNKGLRAVQPRINMSYQFQPGWRLKTSFGTFTQNVITVENEDDLISIFQGWVSVPENLQIQQATHYVLGVEGNIVPELSTSLTGYYKNYGSLVVFNRDKVEDIDPDYINGTGEAYGLESLIRYGTRTVDVYATYTYAWVKLHEQTYSYFPRYDRRHTLKMLASVRPWTNLSVTVRWEYGSGFPYTPTVGFYDRLTLTHLTDLGFAGEVGTRYVMLGDRNSARLPAYHRMDASVNYKIVMGPIQTTVGAHIINLYDRSNIFYFDRVTGQQVNMLSFYPSATLQLEYLP